MATDIIEQELTPGILSLLPLFYVGWSDSVLSPSEMKMIHEKIDSLDFLTELDKAYLIRWTDPTSPPDEKTFKQWVSYLTKHGETIKTSEKSNLIELGIEIANANNQNHEEPLWNSKRAKGALTDIQQALGIEGHESSKLLLDKLLIDSDGCDVFDKPSFDHKQLQDFLDGEYAGTKDRMRQLLRDPLFAYVTEPDKDIFRLRVLDQVKALAQQGVSAYSFPIKYGGFEKKGDHIAVFEMLGYSDLSLAIKFGVQFGLFGGAVYMLGTDKHHKKYLEAMHRAELLGCFAMTETGHGSNVKGLHTTATYDHETEEIIIHSPDADSGKEYIGNAMHSTMAAVFAQLIVGGENHGVHAILVPIRNDAGDVLPGVTIKDCGYKMGLNGVDNGRLWFDQVRVPKDNLLNKYGDITSDGQYTSPVTNPSKRFFTMLGALVVGRICVGLAGISASKSALTIAIKYALKRRQFSKKDDSPETLIMDYPTHQHRLTPLLAKTYAYYFALRRLADKYRDNEDGDMRHIETLAAGLKSKATWHATRTIQECREACGGKGYLKENRIPDLKADSDIFTTFEGDNTVLMQLVAKGLLTEFKQSFHDEGYRAVIKFLYSKLSNKMTELNPVQARNANQSHILDRQFHLDAFFYREQKLIMSLSGRMRNYLKKRIDPYQAFLKCQTHMVSCAHAYIDNIVLKSFVKAIDTCQDIESKKALNKVCDLYALSMLDEEKGWFLENDYFEGTKTKAIRRVKNKVIQDLRPDLEGLVDAFGIPSELLGAQIV